MSKSHFSHFFITYSFRSLFLLLLLLLLLVLVVVSRSISTHQLYSHYFEIVLLLFLFQLFFFFFASDWRQMRTVQKKITSNENEDSHTINNKIYQFYLALCIWIRQKRRKDINENKNSEFLLSAAFLVSSSFFFLLSLSREVCLERMRAQQENWLYSTFWFLFLLICV